MEIISVIVIGGLVLVAIVATLYMVPLRLWVAAQASGAGVSMLTLIAMRLRRVPPDQIVNARISAVKAGLEGVSVDMLEAHYLARGRVEAVVNALISAGKAGMELDFSRAAAIDLAGRNVLEAVAMSVNPRVIETPKVSAVAKDGIQLLAIARVTVRANIERLVGGAGEETVLARVGEGVVSTIGSADDYKHVLENPDTISKNVLQKGLDAGRRSRSSPSTSPTSTSAPTSARSSRRSRPRRTSRWRRPGRSRAARWRSRRSRR